MKLLQVKIILFQRDFFRRTRKIFRNIPLLIVEKKVYISFQSILEILEYDILRNTRKFFSVTDGSEFLLIPKSGVKAFKEGLSFGIDPLVSNQGRIFLSIRSINRLFNVDVLPFINTKTVCIQQPGKFFITKKGDTLKKIAELLNTSVSKILIENPKLQEPIQDGIKVKIPTLVFNSAAIKKKQ